MHFSASTILATAALLAGSAAAATIDVEVGNGGDRFNPTSVTAAQGDIVRFTFFEDREHNIEVASSADSEGACQLAEGGLELPLQAAGATYDLPVNGTDPTYIFCDPHCQSKGMVFIINPGEVSVAQYAAAARGEAAAAPSSSASSAASSVASSATSVASSVASAGSSVASSVASAASSVIAGATPRPNGASAVMPALSAVGIPAMFAALFL